jgi:hypothetical protein
LTRDNSLTPLTTAPRSGTCRELEVCNFYAMGLQADRVLVTSEAATKRADHPDQMVSDGECIHSAR